MVSRLATTEVAGTVAGVFLLRRDAAALLQLRDQKPGIRLAGTRVPPGGHCNDDESLRRCACREFFEETSYRLRDPRFLSRLLDDHAEGYLPLDLVVYWEMYDGAQPIVRGEGEDLAFVRRVDGQRLGVPGYLLDLWDEAIEAAKLAGQLARTQRHGAPVSR